MRNKIIYHGIKKNMFFVGKDNPMYGRKQSDEAKQKMREASLRGTISTKWMTNGVEQKRVKSDEIDIYINNGFYYGRLKKI